MQISLDKFVAYEAMKTSPRTDECLQVTFQRRFC